MKKLIVVADWADDSLTCQEIRSTVTGFLNRPENPFIFFVSSNPSTIETGFLVNQVVETEERYGRPMETVIFINTDPRLQTEIGVEKSQGAPLIVVKLKSGIYLCGPNAGYCFSFIKNKIDQVFFSHNMDKGSQFRSRDIYSRVCARLMEKMENKMDLEKVSIDTVKTLTGFYIAHIDNYGNIKTTITEADLKGKYEWGDLVSIGINKIKKKVKYVSNLFGGVPGELVIYPGSSGDKNNPALEISIWRHFDEEDISTGAAIFSHPRPGAKIVLI